MSTLRYEKRRRQVELSSDILDDARYDSQQIGWPNLRHLPFAAVWNWLHEERYYDVDLVTRPSHKALTLVLQICSGPQWNTANMLLLAQALEGIFVRGRRKDKTRYLANRICEALRLSPEAFEWFMEFYRLRSAFVHGELPIIRSGTELAWLMPEDQEFPHKAEFLEGRGTALLLAVLQELIETNRHDFVA